MDPPAPLGHQSRRLRHTFAKRCKGNVFCMREPCPKCAANVLQISPKHKPTQGRARAERYNYNVFCARCCRQLLAQVAGYAQVDSAIFYKIAIVFQSRFLPAGRVWAGIPHWNLHAQGASTPNLDNPPLAVPLRSCAAAPAVHLRSRAAAATAQLCGCADAQLCSGATGSTWALYFNRLRPLSGSTFYHMLHIVVYCLVFFCFVLICWLARAL